MKHIYDYVRADGEAELQEAIGRINELGYTLVCVSQYEHNYTVFFSRKVRK